MGLFSFSCVVVLLFISRREKFYKLSSNFVCFLAQPWNGFLSLSRRRRRWVLFIETQQDLVRGPHHRSLCGFLVRVDPQSSWEKGEGSMAVHSSTTTISNSLLLLYGSRAAELFNPSQRALLLTSCHSSFGSHFSNSPVNDGVFFFVTF
jgi:hypothetical protein